MEGISIVGPGEKADFLPLVRGRVVFLLPAPEKADLTVPERAAFQRTGLAKAASIVPEKEAPDPNDLLTENRAQAPADSVTAISPFSVTGKVPGRK